MGFKKFIKGVGSSIKSGAKGLASDIKSGAKGLARDSVSAAKGFKRDIVDTGLLSTGLQLAAGFLPGGSMISGAIGVASNLLGGTSDAGAAAMTYEPDLEQVLGYPYPTPETQVAMPTLQDAKSVLGHQHSSGSFGLSVSGSGVSGSGVSGSGASGFGSFGSGASAASFAPLLLGALYLLSKKSSGV